MPKTAIYMFLQVLFRAIFLLILGRAVISWFRPARFNRTYYEVERFLHRTTEPILAPIRRLLPISGTIDWSPVVAILLLGIVERLVLSLLW